MFVMDKKYPVKSDKWKFATSFLMKKYYLVKQHILPIQHMVNKFIPDKSTNNNINKFQVDFMTYPGNKKYNTIEYHIVISMGTEFTGDNLASIRKVL